MRIVNIIGVLVGVTGIVLTFINTDLEYAEGPARAGIANKHDDIGNVFSLLSFLFLILTIICAYNWYKIAKSKSGIEAERGTR